MAALATNQRHAAARHHAFFDCRAGRVQSVFDAGLLSFISTSVAAPTLITATPPASLATLLQLLAVVVEEVSSICALIWPMRDLMASPSPAPSMMVVFSLRSAPSSRVAQIVDRGLLQLQPDFLGNHRAAGEDGHVFQHRLATVAEARGLDRCRP